MTPAHHPQDTSGLQAGSRLDRYELICKLAEGGMASVWLARLQGKRGFEKLLAIKTIKKEFAQDKQFEAMFLDEARIAAGIHHPNVVEIADLGETEGTLYLVMEFVDGDSLSRTRRHALKKGLRLPLGVSLRIVADACAGLHAAHELRDYNGRLLEVVHRDISPQNILVSMNGAAKVIDFGIAKAQGRLVATRAGVLKGKLHYMAPEQATGRAIDRRVDVWAMGVVLYELLTNRRPFEGENDVDVLHAIANATTPPQLPPEIPPRVQEIIHYALQFDPASRFGNAAAMQRAVETVLADLRMPTTAEDVARFLQQHVADLAETRRTNIQRAIEAAGAGRFSAVPSVPSRDSSGGYGPSGPISRPRTAHPGAPVQGGLPPTIVAVAATPAGFHQNPPPSTDQPTMEVSTRMLQGEEAPTGATAPVSAPSGATAVSPKKKSKAGLVAAILGLLVVAGGATAVLVFKDDLFGEESKPTKKAAAKDDDDDEAEKAEAKGKKKDGDEDKKDAPKKKDEPKDDPKPEPKDDPKPEPKDDPKPPPKDEPKAVPPPPPPPPPTATATAPVATAKPTATSKPTSKPTATTKSGPDFGY